MHIPDLFDFVGLIESLVRNSWSEDIHVNSLFINYS